MQTPITDTKVRKTYPQNWKAYNAAQTTEKAHFLDLLHALCAGVEEPPQTNGRPRILRRDAIFAICFKIYSTMSGRRFMTDLREAQAKGYIQRKLHYNSIFHYLDNEALSPILRDLIVRSSVPLAGIETDFAADSSGFTVSQLNYWRNHKYGQKKEHAWVKVHIMCGVKTNIVTAVEIRDMSANDSPMLPPLVAQTEKNFTMREVSADKAYGSYKNYDAIAQAGATPYIVFRSNNTGAGYRHNKYHKKNLLWAKMYHLFKFHEEEFYAHYHKRSNVETAFSMIKAKFGGYVRSKTDTARINECLAKILCHNICVLIQEIHELGIDVDFS